MFCRVLAYKLLCVQVLSRQVCTLDQHSGSTQCIGTGNEAGDTTSLIHEALLTAGAKFSSRVADLAASY
jgi:hypothetical protein